MSESTSRSSHVSSPLSHFPRDQRGSAEFQRELNEISGTSRHPIDPATAISEEAAVNIARVESSMHSGSSSLHLHLDPLWAKEDFHSLRDPEGWKGKQPSRPQGGLIDFSLIEDEPRQLSKEEADAQIEQMIRARRKRKHIDLSDESGDTPSNASLGGAYYDLGSSDDDSDPSWREGDPLPEYKDEFATPEATSAELEEVTRSIDLCNYDYVPDPSEVEYVATPQPELEGAVTLGPLSDDASSSSKPQSPRILACRDLSTTLSEEELAELVDSYGLRGRVVLPRPHQRCYRFNFPENGGRIPRLVLSSHLVRLGITSPLHPFIKDVCDFYHLAPLQINPNAYRSMIALYIIYGEEGFGTLDARTLGYFLQLKRSPKKDFGYVYFSVWPEYNGKSLVFGAPSNAGPWKGPFFYIYDVPRVKTSFNYNPGELVGSNFHTLHSVLLWNLICCVTSQLPPLVLYFKERVRR